MNAPAITIPATSLRTFVGTLFTAAGIPADEAEIVARSLVEANLRGHDSHGVMRAADYVEFFRDGSVRCGVGLHILRETPVILHADAQRGFGQVQCGRFVDALVAKAAGTGIAVGALKGSGHVGRLGEWAERAALAGCASWLAINDNGVPMTVAPPGGIEGRISTNPLAIGVPTGEAPLVLDMSTSAVANGKVTVARLAGEACPPGWIQDSSGNPSTDPTVLVKEPRGSLLPFGGVQAYKGFGLGVMLDMLVSGLSGGHCPPAPDGVPELNNVLAIVWNPDHWSGRAHWIAEVEKLIASVRATPTRPGVSPIQLPGERSRAEQARREREGIPLVGENWSRLVELAGKLGVAVPRI